MTGYGRERACMPLILVQALFLPPEAPNKAAILSAVGRFGIFQAYSGL